HRQRRDAAEAHRSRIAEGAATPGLIAVNQGHVGAAAQQVPSRTHADNAGADHDDRVASVCGHQASWMLASRLTRPGRSVWSLMKARNSADELATTSAPCSRMRARTTGSASTAMLLRWRVSMIAAGVLAGASRPYQVPVS